MRHSARAGRKLLAKPVVPCWIKAMQFPCNAALVGFFVLSFTARSAELDVPENVVFQRDIEYSNPDEQHLQLNIARPKGGNAANPTILCIHGGGFRAGTREGYNALCV